MKTNVIFHRPEQLPVLQISVHWIDENDQVRHTIFSDKNAADKFAKNVHSLNYIP